MKSRTRILAVVLSSALLMACLLPGMIPLKSEPNAPMPAMEKDGNKVIEVLQGPDWRYLQVFATEQYTQEEYDKPGTLTFTVNIQQNLPIYFSWGWCAVDEQTLQQNMQHIHVKLYFNQEELGKDVVHTVTYTQNNQPCADYGVLLTDWPDGQYALSAVATFDQQINDGMADYNAGDYVMEYNVTVKQQKEGAPTPSPANPQTGILEESKQPRTRL